MKPILNLFKQCSLAFLACNALFFAKATNAQTTNANEFWICTSTNTSNLGTEASPYDCSTSTKFNTVINNMPAYSTIHVMAGTYQTPGWTCPLKSGQKLLGSGMDVTILQLQTDDSATLTSGYICTNIEVCDMTLDANYSGGSHNRDGVTLSGSMNAIRRVKVINCAHYNTGSGSEAWGIVLNGYFMPQGTSASAGANIIEGCEVSHYAGGANGIDLFAISINSVDGSSFGVGKSIVTSGIIRNNRVLATHDNVVLGLGCNGENFLIEGNYVENAAEAFHSETPIGWTNVTIVNNNFKNCGLGVDLHGGANKLIFAFNNIEVSDTLYNWTHAFDLNNDSGASYTNILIFGNNIKCSSSANSAANYLIYGQNISGLTFAYNYVDPRLTNCLQNCVNVSMNNNVDTYGNYLPNLNIPTIGGYAVTQVGLGLISSTTRSTALMNLGLPASLNTIVTNTSTQPILFTTNVAVVGGISNTGTNSASYFAGNGGGLTNITATTLVGDQTILFQPTSGAGWYRLAIGDNVSTANVRITRNGGVVGDTQAEDLEFDYLASAYFADPNRVGSINVLRGYVWGGGITAARIGVITNTIRVYLDLYCDNNYNSPFLIQTHGGYNSGYFQTPQYVGSTNLPLPNKTLSLYGIDSGAFQGISSFRYAAGTNSTTLNDDGGKILNSALNIVDPAHGGLGLDGSGWSANQLPYATGAGSFAPAYLGPSLTIQNYTNVVGGTTFTGQTLLFNSFTSQEYALAAGVIANVAHSFSNSPSYVKWVLVCKTNNVGYRVGDEVDVNGVLSGQPLVFANGANSTNVFLIMNNTGTFQIINKTNFVPATISLPSWKAKCYARP
jgi:hypothetical protein